MAIDLPPVPELYSPGRPAIIRVGDVWKHSLDQSLALRGFNRKTRRSIVATIEQLTKGSQVNFTSELSGLSKWSGKDVLPSLQSVDVSRAMPILGTFAAAASRGLKTASAGVVPKAVTYSDYDADEVDRTTYTFTGKNIGTASADRRVHVAVWAGNGGVTLSSMTIGGVTATANLGATAMSSFGQAAISTANVPTGTTATIVINWSGGQTRCGIVVWWSVGLTSDNAVATGSTTTDGGTITLSGSVAGGFAICGAFANGGSPTMTFGGSPTPTEDLDTLPAVMGTALVSGAHVSTTGSNQTFIPDWSNFIQAGAVAAAF